MAHEPSSQHSIGLAEAPLHSLELYNIEAENGLENEFPLQTGGVSTSM